jgi:hypothetical protein
MDPLSAIGLASAIIQFVDFGSKILVTGYETYHSVHGTINDNIELESLTRSLYKFQEQLTISPKQLGHSDPELQKLAQESSNIAGDLLQLLESFKVKEQGLIRTWGVLRESCRAAWKKDEIAKKEKLLNSISSQVNSRLIYMIR